MAAGPCALIKLSGSSPSGKMAKRRLWPGLEVGKCPLRRSRGRSLAGCVSVETQIRFSGDTPEQLDLILCKCRTQRRHRGIKAGLVKGNHICVSLSHNQLLFFARRRQCLG